MTDPGYLFLHLGCDLKISDYQLLAHRAAGSDKSGKIGNEGAIKLKAEGAPLRTWVDRRRMSIRIAVRGAKPAINRFTANAGQDVADS